MRVIFCCRKPDAFGGEFKGPTMASFSAKFSTARAAALFFVPVFALSLAPMAGMSHAAHSAAPAGSAHSVSATAAPPDIVAGLLVRVRDLLKKGQLEPALKRLQGDWGQQLAQNQAEAITFFARARILEDLKRDSDAQNEYGAALKYMQEKKSPMEAQTKFSAGKFYSRMGKPDLAKVAFIGVIAGDKRDVPVAIRTRAVLELAQIHAQAQQWRDVVKILQPAMKAARGQDVYPSYMYLLLKAKRKQNQTDCKLARDIYAKYPATNEISAWGPLLQNNKIDDVKMNCSASTKDIQTRLRRMQLSGQLDRAIQEIHDLKSAGLFDARSLDYFEIGAYLPNAQNQ